MAFEGIQNFMQGGNIDAASLGVQGLEGLAFLGKIIFYFTIAAGIVIVYWKFYLQYKIRVTIDMQEGGKIINTKYDKAREYVDEQGKHKLKLFKMRRTTPLPEKQYRYRFGKLAAYHFVEDDNTELHPVLKNYRYTGSTHPLRTQRVMGTTRFGKILAGKQFEDDEVRDVKAEMVMIPQERKAWMLMENRNLENKIKQKDRAKELLQLAIPIVAYTTAFLIFFFGFKHLSNIGASVGSALGDVAKACLGGG